MNNDNRNQKATYIADTGLGETFADSVTSVGFDGANFRIELAVGRMSGEGGSRQSTVHPIARLVIPMNAASEFLQKLGGAFADLEKQGVLKKATAPGRQPVPEIAN